MCFHSIFPWRLLCHFWCFLRRTSNSPYATSLELKNLSFGLVILGYELAGFFFALSCIKVHFTGCMFWHILCTLSTINGLRIVCVYDRMICCCKEDMSKREAEMKKEEKEVRVWDLNRSTAVEAQAWEKLIGYEASPFYKSAPNILFWNVTYCINHEHSQKTKSWD